MKAFVQGEKISVQAIAGTHVVLLGFNATDHGKKGLIGFGISRKDEFTREVLYLKGYKYFAHGQIGADSMTNPVQAFLWGDYSALPGKSYLYTIVPFYGNPAHPEKDSLIQVRVLMEESEHKRHAVFFNRGVAGSQYYSNEFGQYRKYYLNDVYGRKHWEEYIKPDDVPNNKAWNWLSRGLEEAMTGFIKQADGSEYSIRASLYELTYGPVLDAFAAAMETGADIKIIHHSKNKNTKEIKKGEEVTVQDLDEVGEAAKKVINQVGIRKKDYTLKWHKVFIRRTKAQISHNKFIVLLKNKQPVQVWTGSTNITAGGIFGQSNVGHIVRDPDIAKHYYAFWKELSKDPKHRTAKNGKGEIGICNWNVEYQKDLIDKPEKNSMKAIFSPRLTTDMLKWYAKRLGEAKNSIHFTAAFGVSSEIGAELVQEPEDTPNGPIVRQILLESKHSKKHSEKLKSEAQKSGKPIPLDYYDFIKIDNNQIAYGDLMNGWEVKNAVGTEEFHQEYLTGLNTYVDYLHTKYLLIDPLTDNPLVISGSANFSDASTVSNDENMLVIEGNTRVADIFLSEFTRLFHHFRMRNILNGLSPEERQQAVHLCMDDSWTDRYYQKGTAEYDERVLFGNKKSSY